MRWTVLGSFVALAIGATAAQAADMPLKARPAPDPIWTGGYLGANIGYSWGRSRSTETFNDAAGAALFVAQDSFKMNGAIGGGQIGYNWQQRNWVFGLEADIQGSLQKGSTTFVCPTGVCSPPFGLLAVFPGPAIDGTLNQKLKWFGTVRARAGVLVEPTLLAYATGGLAYGSIKSELTLAIPSSADIFSSSTTKVGWTVGAGVEKMLGGNWSAKLEYLYMDLGTVSNSFATTIPALGGGLIGLNTSSKITDNILRVGLNYTFR
jgi:outer membrane immunogenic protein